MTDNDKCESDTSSTSSWTVLEGQQEGKNINQPLFESNLFNYDLKSSYLQDGDCSEDIDGLEITQRCDSENNLWNVNETVDISDTDVQEDTVNNSPEHGCLTYEEYMKEQSLAHEYDYDMYEDNPRRWEKASHRKKCKADSLGTLTIISTVMAVAGVSFLCLLAPKNYSLTVKEIQKLKTQFNSTDPIKTQTVMPVCPVYSGKNDDLSVSDPKNVISTLLVRNETSTRQNSKNIRKNKILKSLGNINLLRDECPAEHMAQTRPYTAFAGNNSSRFKKNSVEVKIKKSYGPDPQTFRDIKNTKVVSTDNNLNVDEVEQNSKSGFSLAHCKLICNVVQDLMLLRMLRSVTKERRKLAHTKQNSKQAIKVLRNNKEKVYQNDDWENTSYEDVRKPVVSHKQKRTLNSKSESRCVTAKPSCEQTKRKESAAKVISKPSRIENSNNQKKVEAPPVRRQQTEKSLDIANKVEKHDIDSISKRKDDYLSKLRRAQQEQMEQIRAARERRQESILSLMNERRKYIEKIKEATSGKQARPRTPPSTSNEISNKLQKIKAEHNLTARSDNYETNNKVNNSNQAKEVEVHRRLTQTGDSVSSAVYYKILSEYVSSQKKHLERQSNYWSKREELLNERIQFLREASSTIKLIAQNCRNSNALSITSIEKIVDTSISVFESDSDIQNLKNQFNNQLSDSRYSMLIESPSGAIVPIEKTTEPNLESKKVPSSSSVSTNAEPISKPKAKNVPIQDKKKCSLKSSTYYNLLFGKIGHQIRKRDASVRFRNRTTKTKLQRDVSKQDPQRKNKKNMFKK